MNVPLVKPEKPIAISLSDSQQFSNFPMIAQPGIPVKEEVKDLLASHFDHSDL
jgi:hypothetical protein